MLILTVAAISGTSAFLGAIASTHSRTAALEAKIADLRARFKISAQRPPGQISVVGNEELGDSLDERPIPKPRAFLIH